ncbi:MAG: sensor histidine kinase [Desulfobacula sp.]|nr:sensor histidine kinase [Desulfobacula sp.]
MIAVSVLVITMTPLLILAFADYSLTKKALEKEMISETSRSLTNFNQVLTSFLEEKKIIITRILTQHPFDELIDSSKLNTLLGHLNILVSGFQGIAVFDSLGVLQASAGLFEQCNDQCLGQMTRKKMSLTTWKETEESPSKLIITIKYDIDKTQYFIARFVQDLNPLLTLINSMVLGMEEGAFILDREGMLLISAGAQKGYKNLAFIRNFEDPKENKIFKIKNENNETLIAGHSLIPGTFWRLVVISPQKEIISKWYQPRVRLTWALALSIGLLVFIILGTATYIVNHIHHADQQRIMALHQVEYTNKLNSIARLSSGVAHEVNNPLAIIGEKAGLINDIFRFQDTYKADKRLADLTHDILVSVERCSTVTRRLLNFSQHMNTSFSLVNPCQVLREVLVFIRKDAEHKGIEIKENIPEDIPGFHSNHGHLQQIFLNLLHNSMTAIGSDGIIEITIKPKEDNTIEFSFKDNGCGITQKDLHFIFEPFFTTEPGHHAIGLGLSITYGLIKEIDGKIFVHSTPGKGSEFIIVLPSSVKKSPQINGSKALEEKDGE